MYYNKLAYDPILKKLARDLRKNSTLSEILLWQHLKHSYMGYDFHRQKPISKYIVDSKYKGNTPRR
ncbi:MAG: DUF559 domain-containing protein [Pelosinus sp.]|nr:DUF559 domain-containing protein [Pelosinus sp.]